MNPELNIVAAFPATGKTWMAMRDLDNLLDSDSSLFSWAEPGVRGERHRDWPSNYVTHIQKAVANAKRVFCSSHQEVRDALVEAGLAFTLVYPGADLRDEYLNRIVERGSPPAMVEFISDNWNALIASCVAQAGCGHVVLRKGQFLADVLEASP